MFCLSDIMKSRILNNVNVLKNPSEQVVIEVRINKNIECSKTGWNQLHKEMVVI
jgi:hypothetical protein